MSLLRVLPRRPAFTACWKASRSYASAGKAATKAEPVQKPAPQAVVPIAPGDGSLKSSCLEGTELVGLNWLKGQLPVLSKADEEYPPWLWTLLQPKELPDDGPGGRAEKVRLRKQNRQNIRERNFMSTQ